MSAAKRVLVADRDEIILGLTRHILTRNGYSVELARDTATLRQRLGETTYDAILIDARLDGFSAFVRDHADLRIVAMVTDGEADGLPVSATILKPLELDALTSVVESDPNAN